MFGDGDIVQRRAALFARVRTEPNPVTRWALREMVAQFADPKSGFKAYPDHIHPHPDKRHIMQAYRRYLIGMPKAKRRSLIHYRPMLLTYLEARRQVQP